MQTAIIKIGNQAPGSTEPEKKDYCGYDPSNTAV